MKPKELQFCCRYCFCDVEYDREMTNEWVHSSTGEEQCEDKKHLAEVETKDIIEALDKAREEELDKKKKEVHLLATELKVNYNISEDTLLFKRLYEIFPDCKEPEAKDKVRS